MDLRDLQILLEHWRTAPPENELLAAMAVRAGAWAPPEEAKPAEEVTAEDAARMGMAVRPRPTATNVPGLPGYKPPDDLE